DLLGDTVKALGAQAHAKGLGLSLLVGESVPDWVVGDRARLRQVLVNLVGNAIKFTDCGEVVVSVAASGERAAHPAAYAAGSPGVCIRVSDTGIGIPPEKQRAVFDPFVQADGSLSRRHGGTGLGLSISQRLVELMGGKIWLES